MTSSYSKNQMVKNHVPTASNCPSSLFLDQRIHDPRNRRRVEERFAEWRVKSTAAPRMIREKVSHSAKFKAIVFAMLKVSGRGSRCHLREDRREAEKIADNDIPLRHRFESVLIEVAMVLYMAYDASCQLLNKLLDLFYGSS
ncbi:hypothetical protein KM043_004603 [Ampulex compressa]|nr:hypothetical protein KM043_004603 [Ampulex compressa]